MEARIVHLPTTEIRVEGDRIVIAGSETFENAPRVSLNN
jgi:hypothetical protein